MNKTRRFFLFFLGREKLAIPLSNFILVKELPSNKEEITYNRKTIKTVNLRNFFDPDSTSFELALVVQFKGTYFAILASSLLDTVEINEDKVKSTRDLFDFDYPLITEVIVFQNGEIVKILNLESVKRSLLSGEN